MMCVSVFCYSQAQPSNNVLPNGNTVLPCGNWLSTSAEPSYANIGNLNITGNQLTIEAVINRTLPYLPGIGDGNEGDIVSKHDNPSDVNYLLRPNHAYITTTNGYFGTPDICEIELNKTYHVAMVYDGTALKFYRNGYLMSSVPATGNLVQNLWPTRIGRYSGTYLSTFLGYINEVRIWNVARSQNDIRNYMDLPLASPTTELGLLAYYSFDNLLNKQGNASWNAVLGGSASINATNTSCSFIADSCLVSTCTNWLNPKTYPSYVNIGDLDIPGNTVTVEALINRTEPYLPGGGNDTEGDVVSKHTDPPNVNYLLRPNHAYITTTNGFFGTPDICEIQLNKTYHIAMVYDGATLKYYRDGFLLSQVNATGNLIQSNIQTRIGLYAGGLYSTQFKGYINEVRIWNTARSQAEIRSFMNTSLTNPSTQTGLLAYYTFDNLLNKQGNAIWNGSLVGDASINATNTNCTFVPDSCSVVPVNLTDFKVSVINNKSIKLTWNTESESNIKNYTVQRSATGFEPDFIELGAVVSEANSHSNQYSFIDNTAKPNTLYYYKLLINDHDGSKKFSPVRTAKITNKEFYALVYPNPTDGIIKVILNNASADAVITIRNEIGQVVKEKRVAAVDSNSLSMDISSVSKGVYFISIISGNDKYVEKIIKL